MKYSLFTVSVPEMNLEQVLEKLKENGYDGVDWRVTAIPTDPEILAEKPSYWRNNLCTIDIDKVEEQAEKYGHSLERELAFLTAHSMLHLCGYDHMDDEKRQQMEERQREILSGKGYDR